MRYLRKVVPPPRCSRLRPFGLLLSRSVHQARRFLATPQDGTSFVHDLTPTRRCLSRSWGSTIVRFERLGRGDGCGSEVAIHREVSLQSLWLARFKPCHKPAQGSRLRNQSGGKIRPGRGRRRCSIVDGAHLAGVSGYRHLLGSAWDGGRADARRVDPDPHRRAGRSFDRKQMARAPVRGGSERPGRISGPGRRPVGRNRPLSGSDKRICGPPYRDGATRLGRITKHSSM